MSFDVPCECGSSIVVSEGGAGARIACSCGRTVTVPSLDELRQQAGLPLPVPNPVLVIEHMLACGELPTIPTCARCDATDADTLLVTAECEKVGTSEPSLFTWLLAVWFFGVLAILLRQRDPAEYGGNRYVHLPVRLCRHCRRRFARTSLAWGWTVLAIPAAVIGVLVVVNEKAWGWLLLLLAGLSCIAAMLARNRRRAALKQLLAREPIYYDLLQYYPDARLLFGDQARQP